MPVELPERSVALRIGSDQIGRIHTIEGRLQQLVPGRRPVQHVVVTVLARVGARVEPIKSSIRRLVPGVQEIQPGLIVEPVVDALRYAKLV